MSRLSISMKPKACFQLLEINVINAQDLYLVSRKMRTYAIAWVHPNRKLSTRVDNKNVSNPSWNDKFVFRVDEAFLRSDTASVMIEIYAVKWFKDVRVGSVNVLVGNLLPPATRNQPFNSGMRFLALQVRRPSGRPQGILNIGVTILDGSMRSMPLYSDLRSSAVGYRDLMGEEPNSPNHHPIHKTLFRSRSARHSDYTETDFRSQYGDPPPFATITTGSVWSESEVGPRASALAPSVRAHDLYSLPGGAGDEWEDLKKKLERWKTELPAHPVVEKNGSVRSVKQKGNGHRRRHTDGGTGLFSCFFGDVYGMECAVTCGVKPKKGKRIEGVLSDSSDGDGDGETSVS